MGDSEFVIYYKKKNILKVFDDGKNIQRRKRLQYNHKVEQNRQFCRTVVPSLQKDHSICRRSLRDLLSISCYGSAEVVTCVFIKTYI